MRGTFARKEGSQKHMHLGIVDDTGTELLPNVHLVARMTVLPRNVGEGRKVPTESIKM